MVQRASFEASTSVTRKAKLLGANTETLSTHLKDDSLWCNNNDYLPHRQGGRRVPSVEVHSTPAVLLRVAARGPHLYRRERVWRVLLRFKFGGLAVAMAGNWSGFILCGPADACMASNISLLWKALTSLTTKSSKDFSFAVPAERQRPYMVLLLYWSTMDQRVAGMGAQKKFERLVRRGVVIDCSGRLRARDGDIGPDVEIGETAELDLVATQ